jgi:uncharacterized protein (TIGR02466 family)
MSVNILFPAFVFERNHLGEDEHIEEGMNAEYFNILKNEIDAMRRDDPLGRSVSNSGGWQSVDKIDSNPIFVKAIRSIKRMIRTEMMPFLGRNEKDVIVNFHNSWANINDSGAWNKPHLHNGCFYSGVMYIDADGTEGDFSAIDTNHKVVGTFPNTPRIVESWKVSPKTGDVYLFPSGLMHMVEPNYTNKERYSISFNFDVAINSDDFRKDIKYPGLRFKVDESGDIIV